VDGDTFYTADVVGQFRQVASDKNAVFCFEDTQEDPIYSYIKVDEEDNISEVKEKVKISDWANSGCYCFRDGSQLATECEALIESGAQQASQDGVGEFYTSGVIAAMLAKKEPFQALKLKTTDIHVLGTPAQVEQFCVNWPTQTRQRIVFDLEGVLITGFKGAPIKHNIDLCQRLKKQGHTIIINSTRNYGLERITWAFLAELKIPYDELYLGKPRGEIYISGHTTACATLGDLNKQIGFHETEVRAGPRQRPPMRREEWPKRAPKMQKVVSLRPEARGVTVAVKVLSEVKEVENVGKYGGSAMKFFEVECGDSSARVTLSLTASQVEGFEKDRVIVVRNGSVRMVKGHIRLCVDKWGKLDQNTEEQVPEIGQFNVSATEYELV